MSEPSIAPVERYVEELWERDANRPPAHGRRTAVDAHRRRTSPRCPGTATLTADDTERILRELAGTELFERLHAEREIDFSFGWVDRARLRANAFHQRGALSLSLRIIPFEIPSMDELGLPEAARPARAAAAGPHPRHRSDRCRQVDIARFDARLDQHEPARVTSSRSKTRSSTCTGTSAPRSTNARSGSTP